MKPTSIEIPTPQTVQPPRSAEEAEYEELITEDHKPVDRIHTEKQYRLLTQPLYVCWHGPGGKRPFLALANVGWFYQRKTPAVVPDVMLSLDVTCPEDLHSKSGHSYYQWVMNKSPDVIIEIVSDKLGGEFSSKMNLYASMQVPFYAVYDPELILSTQELRTFELTDAGYRETTHTPWPQVGLGLTLWQGAFEDHDNSWLRWCDLAGNLIPTPEEFAASAAANADNARQEALKAKTEAKKAKTESKKAKDEATKAKDESKKAKDEAAKAKDEAAKAKDEAAKAKDQIRLLEERLRALGDIA